MHIPGIDPDSAFKGGGRHCSATLTVLYTFIKEKFKDTSFGGVGGKHGQDNFKTNGRFITEPQRWREISSTLSRVLLALRFDHEEKHRRVILLAPSFHYHRYHPENVHILSLMDGCGHVSLTLQKKIANIFI